MKTQYEIKHLLKLYEEDSFKNGCVPNTGGCSTVDVSFQADTIDELIKKVCDFVNGDFEGKDKCWEVDSTSNSKVIFGVMETDDSNKPTQSQIEEWKQGRLRLWDSSYIGMINKVTKEEVDLIKHFDKTS